MLGGGAVRGAFQAGVVSAFAAAGVRFDVICGTLVGAINGAAFLLGCGPDIPDMWRDSLRELEWVAPRRLLPRIAPSVEARWLHAPDTIRMGPLDLTRHLTRHGAIDAALETGHALGADLARELLSAGWFDRTAADDQAA